MRNRLRRIPLAVVAAAALVASAACGGGFDDSEHEAPDVFQIRREGRLTYQDRVKVANLDPVVRAVEVCPARAIVLGKLPRRYRY
jgi:ferredoxin